MRRLLISCGLLLGLSGCSAMHTEYAYTREQAALIGAKITSENISNEKLGEVLYQFNFLDRYRISHSFWWGDSDGLCRYGLKVLERGEWAWINRSKFMVIPPVIEKTGDLIKRGDKLYQDDFRKDGWSKMDMSPYVKGGKSGSFSTSLCRASSYGYGVSISLNDGSTESIEQRIIEHEKYAILRRIRVDAPVKVRRMNNEWTMIRLWRDGIPDEFWFLPIGKSDYYYLVHMTDISNRGHFTPALNRLLDSFQIIEIESPVDRNK